MSRTVSTTDNADLAVVDALPLYFDIVRAGPTGWATQATGSTNRTAGHTARRHKLSIQPVYPQTQTWMLLPPPGILQSPPASRRMSRSRVRIPSAFSTQRGTQ